MGLIVHLLRGEGGDGHDARGVVQLLAHVLVLSPWIEAEACVRRVPAWLDIYMHRPHGHTHWLFGYMHRVAWFDSTVVAPYPCPVPSLDLHSY